MLDKIKYQFSSFSDSYKNKSYLVAASAGLDSTALLYLCDQLGLDFAICHCNFELRGEESEDDQVFLENLSSYFKVPIFTKRANAKIYAEHKHLSIQESAREIRYTWFDECVNTHSYDVVLTAHHADDNIETYLINSFRGTGLTGLTGIPKQRGVYFRPLLGITRSDILNYAKANNFKWRDDSSNTSNKYLRNILRQHLVPFFSQNGDDMYSRINTTFSHLNSQSILLNDYIDSVIQSTVTTTKQTIQIDLHKLKSFSNYHILLCEVLRAYGFRDSLSIAQIIDTQNGKTIYSKYYQLVKERGFLELYKIDNDVDVSIEIDINTIPENIKFSSGILSFSDQDSFTKSTSDIAFFDKDKLTDKLCLRPMQKGDFFYPLGMRGKRKLSDFCKDEKLTNFEKSKLWVLTHAEQIIWVVNHRIDDRYKITKTTNTCLKVSYLPY